MLVRINHPNTNVDYTYYLGDISAFNYKGIYQRLGPPLYDDGVGSIIAEWTFEFDYKISRKIATLFFHRQHYSWRVGGSEGLAFHLVTGLLQQDSLESQYIIENYKFREL